MKKFEEIEQFYGRRLFDLFQEWHSCLKMKSSEIAGKIYKDTRILYSGEQITRWIKKFDLGDRLKKLKLQKLHHVQMNERYKLGRVQKKPRSASKLDNPKVFNRKKQIAIFLKDKDFNEFNEFRMVNKKGISELVNAIYKIANLDPKINYLDGNKRRSRPQIVIETLRNHGEELAKMRMTPKKGITFLVRPNSVVKRYYK